MSKSIDEELQAIVEQLPQHQLETLKQLFSDDTFLEQRMVKKVLPKDKTFECEVLVVCRLCKTIHKQVFKSVSSMPSKITTPTCGKCAETLRLLPMEEVISLAIRASEGCFTAVVEAKNAPVEGCLVDLTKKGESDE